MAQDFDKLFEQATGKGPYPYQHELATGVDLPELLRVPTGAGKTAAVLVAWIYRRRFAAAEVRARTPRRLVYCLPMRVLVEQTRDVAKQILENLKLLAKETSPERIAVHVLMGGDLDRDWVSFPERDAVLIGTQDMLLSRALNRGYGESRYRWPASFGMLNNDALWVLDEVQLMGAGLATSCQVQALRNSWRTFGSSQTLWMSATVGAQNLKTVDHPLPKRVQELDPADRKFPSLKHRLEAHKPIERSPAKVGKDTADYAKRLADEIRAAHEPGTLSLIVLNTVDRARALHAALTAVPGRLGKGKKQDASPPGIRPLLLHSRFRPTDRQRLIGELLAQVPAEGRIVISTQVVEAGVDISAKRLWTELAPWPSLVQRFGRCNRTGDDHGAQVFWMDLDTDSDRARDWCLPYAQNELEDARKRLRQYDDVGPSKLGDVDLPTEITHVPRRRDLLELFDTMPDVSGGEIDISRFVRDTDDRSLQVFWRATADWAIRGSRTSPPDDLPRPGRAELCSAPIGELRALLERTRKIGDNGWVWSVLDGAWVPLEPSKIRPGLVVLLRSDLGGYSAQMGWSKDSVEPVIPIDQDQHLPSAGADDDVDTFGHADWLSLSEHSNDAARLASDITRLLEGAIADERLVRAVRLAARWHDTGKAHPAFQSTLLSKLGSDERAQRAEVHWAKSPHRGRHRERPRFRHELASALAVLGSELPAELRDIVAYLVAAHHGHVRLSIRSLEGEKRPPETGRKYALGIWDGEALPSADIGDGVRGGGCTLDLSIMELGWGKDERPSWTDRAIRLRDELGPFRLAFLEALVIAADWRASAEARKESKK